MATTESPISTTWLDSKDVDGPEYVVQMVGDFNTNQQFNREYWIVHNGEDPTSNIPRCAYLSEPRLRRGSRTQGFAICVFWPQSNLRIKPANPKASNVIVSRLGIGADKDRIEDRMVGFNEPMVCRNTYAWIVVKALRQALDSNMGIFCKSVRRFESGLAYGLAKNVEDVVISKIPETRNGNKLPIRNLNNLAVAFRRCLSEETDSAIGAKINTGAIPDDDDRRSTRGHSKNRRYSNNPHYLRETYLGSDLMPAGDPTIIDLRSVDIDVSNDAIHWFHFGGDICLRDLPVYRSAP